MSLKGVNDTEKLRDLCGRNYKAQAIWFLNSFWNSVGNSQNENVWNYAHKMSQLDTPNGKEGCALDEMMAHRFLEVLNETLTVRELRDRLFTIGIERTKLVSLTSYLIFKFNVDWHVLVNASQGSNQEEVAEAQRKLDQVQIAFAEVSKTAEIAANKEREAVQAENEARTAQAELQAALNELHAQEAAYKAKVDDLTRRGNDESVGVVTRNKAKAELAQVLAEDPLPLRKAKITQEAAVKKAEKATNIAAEARSKASASANAASQARKQAEDSAQQASQARKAAEQARHQATVAAEHAEAAKEEMYRKLEEAEAYFEEVKSKPGNARGAMWWMERELHEARAYLPERKGGYRKK
eukprot:TRINITY_DN8_c1_g1_i13.p1 TRINITY_DN8_c1_g1~~TRINITY_DN8_c1_g1_i13.p1  ORF type:complete len:367 (+),score=243.31 TRINITY_DN8_c1_g1_i13:40-1101(+)